MWLSIPEAKAQGMSEMNDADAGREAAMAALVEYVVAEWRRERAEAEGKRAA